MALGATVNPTRTDTEVEGIHCPAIRSAANVTDFVMAAGQAQNAKEFTQLIFTK